MLCLDECPEVLAELHADRSLVPAAIEEVLRYRSSFTQVGRAPRWRPSVAFGFGIHFCIGQLLARTEGRVAMGVLLDRYAEIRLNPELPLRFYGRGIVAARNVPVVVEAAQ